MTECCCLSLDALLVRRSAENAMPACTPGLRRLAHFLPVRTKTSIALGQGRELPQEEAETPVQLPQFPE